MAVAVSGGRDSVALLHATVQAARPLGVAVQALHVHHGLMPQADAWQAQVAALCGQLEVPLLAERLSTRPQPGDSIEAWARRERYAALARLAHEAGADLVLLAHHRHDQAETFLLQALRGAGTAGLAAMPARIERHGLTWARPWLDRPREAIEAYVALHGLPVVEDGSNQDPRFARNRLRLQVMPGLNQAFAGAEAALAAAARRSAEADAALAEWADEALRACSEGEALLREAWWGLSPARRLMVLRHWLALRLGQGASQRLVERLLAEWPQAVAASWPAPGGQVLRHYRGRLRVDHAPTQPGGVGPAAHGLASPPCWPLRITGAARVPVQAFGGELVVEPANEGVPLAWLADCELRSRSGGEQFQLAADRPARSLKKMFQQQAVPAWARQGPLLWAAGRLLFVPGLGLDARALHAPEGGPRMRIDWVPFAADCSIGEASADGR
mgnify:CR=1 FL=1